jgi:hypothetical protein
MGHNQVKGTLKNKSWTFYWTELSIQNCHFFTERSLVASSWFQVVEIGILLPKLFWPTVRKNCSKDSCIYRGEKNPVVQKNFIPFSIEIEFKKWFQNFFDKYWTENTGYFDVEPKIESIFSDHQFQVWKYFHPKKYAHGKQRFSSHGLILRLT